MQFEFDPVKAEKNLTKHRVSFADAEGVFNDPLAIHVPDPDAQDEERFVAIGQGSDFKLLVVCYTLRDDKVRLISARRTTKKEAKNYAS